MELLQSTTPDSKTASDLAGRIRPEVCPFNARLQLAEALLINGQTCQIKRLIPGADVRDFIRAAQNSNALKMLFNVLPYIQDISVVIELMEYVETANIFNVERLIDLKLETANSLIMIGKRDSAKTILDSIFSRIFSENRSNLLHPCLLGLHYMHLSEFKAASRVFEIAESEPEIHPELPIYMAVNKLCLGDIDNAFIAIDERVDSENRMAYNLFWKAKLFNYAGWYDEASHWIDKALDASLNDPPVNKCLCLVEKGNTLRSLGNIDEAINCYKKAEAQDFSVGHWLSIACFEHAMTHVYLKNIDDALAIAEKGSHYHTYRYHNRFNPCAVLKWFFAHRSTGQSEMQIYHLADSARLWPLPYLPYKIWMLILIGIVFEENRFHGEAKRVYQELLKMEFRNNKNPVADDPIEEGCNVFCHDRNLMDLLESKLWPNEFNWGTIRWLCDK